MRRLTSRSALVILLRVAGTLLLSTSVVAFLFTIPPFCILSHLLVWEAPSPALTFTVAYLALGLGLAAIFVAQELRPNLLPTPKCPHCGYDLRGTPDAARRPECGRLR